MKNTIHNISSADVPFSICILAFAATLLASPYDKLERVSWLLIGSGHYNTTYHEVICYPELINIFKERF